MRPDSCSMAVINDDGCLLLLQRGTTDPWMPGRWCLPGGKMDPGETPEQTAIRELIEEAGVTPGEVFFFEVNGDGDKSHHVFYTTGHSGEVTLPDGECDDYCWVTREEAMIFPLIPQLSKSIHRIFDLIESL